MPAEIEPREPGKFQDVSATRIVIRDFSGMAPNYDPHDMPVGKSISQINVGVGPQGELRVRLGIQKVRFT